MELSPYGFCLLLGASGLVGMVVAGHWHRHGHASTASRGIDHQLGAPGPTSSLAHHGDAVHAASHGLVRGHGGATRWSSLLSPRAWFGLLVGGGAVGSILRTFAPEPWPLLAAIVGGFVFELGVLAPLHAFSMRFASTPARTLESAVLDHAVAASRFDSKGHGLVSLELDGHVVQLLGTLSMADVALGASVRAGDELVIESIDAERNQCTVSRR